MSRDEEIFAEARQVPPDARAAYLDRACPDDPALRAQIEELLAGFEAAERAMPRAIAERPAAPPGEKPSERIGRYKLLEKIGEGGCGIVWMAEQQEPVRRLVALKVIKLGMDTKAVVARFDAERQALAMMDHPNIAKVLDAGATDSGRPFFVMELVRGVPITTYCDKHHLSTRARLELLVAVCAAIQHAHEKGIIHRDIKPTNILVTVHDGAPVPKVIDFGIAKATQGRLTEHTLFTSFEQFIGTPVYMSPEQADMSDTEVDARSDIYSLGVLLYELLTGQSPFDARELARAGVDEIRRRIREVEPPRPSTRWRTLTEGERTSAANLRGAAPADLSLLLRGDLDWVVMRCLEKDRTRRYESASALAADLSRHLRHEPVTARPPSTAYVVGKFLRRHRVAVAATAAVAGALLIGGTVSVWQARRAAHAEQLAAGLALPPKPAPLSAARQLAARATAMCDKYDSTPADYAAAEGLLKQALALDQNDAEVWAASSIFHTSIRTRGFDHAPVRREMARRDAERALKLAPDSLDALFALGRAQRDIEPDAAEQTFKKMLALNPGEARALHQLARIYDYGGRPDEAEVLYERGAVADPEHAALTRYTEFLLFMHYRRFVEADRAIRQSLAIQPSTNSQSGLAILLLTWKGDADAAARTLASGPTAARTEARTVWMTALVQLCRHAPDEALATLNRLADDFIQDNWFSGPKAYFVGRAQAMAGRMEAARVAWESGLVLTDARLKETPGDRSLHFMRGQLLALLGQTDDALREARTVAELSRGTGAEWFWFVSPAMIYAILGRADEALPFLQRLSNPPANQLLELPLTPALLRLDPIWDKIRDDPRFQKLAASEPSTASADPAKVAPESAQLAAQAYAITQRIGFIREDLAIAGDLAKRATELAPVSGRAWAVRAWVQACSTMRNWDSSPRQLQEVQTLANRALAIDPRDADAMNALAIVFEKQAAPEEQEKIARQAIAAAPDNYRSYLCLGRALNGLGRREESLAALRRAVERFPANALCRYELAVKYASIGSQQGHTTPADVTASLEQIDAALAIEPFASAILIKAITVVAWRGDLATMRVEIDRLATMSLADRSDDRAVFTTMWAGLLERKPDRVLAAAKLNARPYFEDSVVAGPKAWGTALAYRLEGKEALARQEWSAAEVTLRQRLQDPASPPADKIRLAATLAWLGRLDEAAQIAEPVETTWREDMNGQRARFLAQYYAARADAAKAVPYLRQAINTNSFLTSHTLPLDPWWDKLRGQPEFDAFLAEPSPWRPAAPAPNRDKASSPAPSTAH